MNLSASLQYKDTEGEKKLFGCISELQKDEIFFFATLITKWSSLHSSAASRNLFLLEND